MTANGPTRNGRFGNATFGDASSGDGTSGLIDLDTRDGDHRFRNLVASVEPSVVFGSLAALCVPELCDDCTIDIVDGTHARYRIAYPPIAAAAGGLHLADRALTAAADHRVRVPFSHPEPADSSRGEHDPPGGPEEFHGVATFVWHRRTPTRTDRTMASVLVDNAVRTVVWQRSEQVASAAVATAANLQLALQTSRQIGAAVGILMSLHKITQDQGFDLLRRASQSRNCKLRDLALDVIDTGWLDPVLDTDTPRPGPHRS